MNFLFTVLHKVGKLSVCKRSQAPRYYAIIVNILVFFSSAQLNLSHATNALNAILNESEATNLQSKEMVVEADELVNDKDKNILIARGAAQIYREGHIVLADEIIFYRDTKRVVAIGNVKLIEPNGQVVYALTADITQNFQQGFVDSMRSDNPEDGTHFAAQRAERKDGNITEYQKGVYTACPACIENPSKPPIWQVKSAKIIHNKTERTVYYHDARLELWGYPVGYFPFFTAPDPTVRRRSGFLNPRYGFKTALGAFITTPYYFNLAPDYDFTFTPTLTTRQGLHATGEWRQRFETGQYSIKPSGIYQLDPEAFKYPGDRDYRGAISTTGLFNINQNWQWGWDGTIISDRRYLRDYRLGPDTELVSQAFLRGLGERSSFDARIMKYTGLSGADIDRFFPLVHPVIDYNTVFQAPEFLKGEMSFDVNFTSLTRNGLDYNTKQTSTGNFNFINGTPGSSTRLSTQVGWKNTYIDSMGQTWTPFVAVRADTIRFELDTNTNNIDFVPTELRSEPGMFIRAMPSLGLVYKYPFINGFEGGSQIIEPVAQLVVRPNEQRIGSLPNEDAQSFSFDDSNLFDVNKFSGYDRLEGGSRLNAGAQYSLMMNNGFNISAMIGESFHLAGKNSFSEADILRTGFNSGLQSDASDYVTRFNVQPNKNLMFSNRMRFNKDNFAMERGAFDISGIYGSLTANVGYLNIAPRQELGSFVHDQSLYAHLNYNLHENWSIYAGSYHNLQSNKRISEYAGLVYNDECTTFSVEYKGTRIRNVIDTPTHDIMFRVVLRTLGGTTFSQKLDQGTQ